MPSRGLSFQSYIVSKKSVYSVVFVTFIKSQRCGCLHWLIVFTQFYVTPCCDWMMRNASVTMHWRCVRATPVLPCNGAVWQWVQCHRALTLCVVYSPFWCQSLLLLFVVSAMSRQSAVTYAARPVDQLAYLAKIMNFDLNMSYYPKVSSRVGLDKLLIELVSIKWTDLTCAYYLYA